MCSMSYQDAWSYLDRLQFFKIKLGLESMNQLLAEMDSPQQAYPSIHIGGTNGKGSVGATLLAIMNAAGFRVGLYTSPHLSSVRERFRINDAFISQDEFAALAEKIIRTLAGRQITYFEFTTTLAMLWFKNCQIDLALLEVGLGGRLDATNVVTPLVAVITNVGMDHEQYLGNNLKQIAREKAGIIKHGVPVVTGAQQSDVLEVIAEKTAKLGSPLYQLNRDFNGTRHQTDRSIWNFSWINENTRADAIQLNNLPLLLRGAHQVDNTALALATLELIKHRFPINEAHIRQGLRQVAWPGRLEELWHGESPSLHFLLDGAHNPDGARALRAALQNEFIYERLILIWASMADKDVAGTLLEVAPLASEIIFTRLEYERSALAKNLQELLPDEIREVILISCTDSVQEALDLAMAGARPNDLICVAGSLYLVGKARLLLRGELVDAP